jgi:Oxygenase domain of the 2OGFeDO superfamily
VKDIHITKEPERKDWSMQFVDDCDFDNFYDEDVNLFKPDGSPLLCLRKGALSKESVGRAWSVLKNIQISPSNNRGLAGGRPMEKWIRDDGTQTGLVRVARGWEVKSFIVGYFERTTRQPFCHACAWNFKYPEKFAKLLPMAQEVDALLKAAVPERYANQKAYADRTSPDFVIPGTVFTTLTINKTFRTACHKDAGDLESGFSCLSVIRQGVYKGGKLVLPDWKIAVQLDSYDLVMFDAHEFHGNTQIVPISKDAERCSIVYYFREQMVKCGPACEELERAKRRKPGQKLFEEEK